MNKHFDPKALIDFDENGYMKDWKEYYLEGNYKRAKELLVNQGMTKKEADDFMTQLDMDAIDIDNF